MKIAFCDAHEATFPTWRKLQIGLISSVESLRQLLVDDGFKISEYAGQILNKAQLIKSITELELVIVTQADLGFPEGTTFENMVLRAKDYDLEKCPAELGPYLRSIYTDQPKGEWLRIAMEPLSVSGGYLRVFRVGHDVDGLWLYMYWFDPRDVWNPVDQWVFVRSRK